MNTKTTELEVSNAAELLASHLKSVNLGANLAKIAELHKPKRHPFSEDVVSLTALIKDLSMIKSLPMSVVRDNLLSNMEAYLNDKPLFEEIILQERQKNDILDVELQRLNSENQRLIVENQDLQTALSQLREEISEVRNECIDQALEHQREMIPIMSKYQEMERLINVIPRSQFDKYRKMVVKL
jgi:regulator of replication initiation timing